MTGGSSFRTQLLKKRQPPSFCGSSVTHAGPEETMFISPFPLLTPGKPLPS